METNEDEDSAFACNIERSGRIVRGVVGLLSLVAGIYLVTADQAFWGTGLCALGTFAVFEALKGWCALRALGIRTPF